MPTQVRTLHPPQAGKEPLTCTNAAQGLLRATNSGSETGVHMAGQFGLSVRFTLKEGAAAAFDALVAETLVGIKASEPGTLVYVNHTVDGDPNQRIFYELYQNRAAFDTHEQQPH